MTTALSTDVLRIIFDENRDAALLDTVVSVIRDGQEHAWDYYRLRAPHLSLNHFANRRREYIETTLSELLAHCSEWQPNIRFSHNHLLIQMGNVLFTTHATEHERAVPYSQYTMAYRGDFQILPFLQESFQMLERASTEAQIYGSLIYGPSTSRKHCVDFVAFILADGTLINLSQLPLGQEAPEEETESPEPTLK